MQMLPLKVSFYFDKDVVQVTFKVMQRLTIQRIFVQIVVLKLLSRVVHQQGGNPEKA